MILKKPILKEIFQLKNISLLHLYNVPQFFQIPHSKAKQIIYFILSTKFFFGFF